MMTTKQRKARNERNAKHEAYVLRHLDQYNGYSLGEAPLPELPKTPATPRKSAGQSMDAKPMDDCTRKPFSIFA